MHPWSKLQEVFSNPPVRSWRATRTYPTCTSRRVSCGLHSPWSAGDSPRASSTYLYLPRLSYHCGALCFSHTCLGFLCSCFRVHVLFVFVVGFDLRTRSPLLGRTSSSFLAATGVMLSGILSLIFSRSTGSATSVSKPRRCQVPVSHRSCHL